MNNNNIFGINGALVFRNKKTFQSFFKKCVHKNRVFSKSVLLIIMDGRRRRIQMDKKPYCLPCRFGASSPQAIALTRKLP